MYIQILHEFQKKIVPGLLTQDFFLHTKDIKMFVYYQDIIADYAMPPLSPPKKSHFASLKYYTYYLDNKEFVYCNYFTSTLIPYFCSVKHFLYLCHHLYAYNRFRKKIFRKMGIEEFCLFFFKRKVS